MTNDDETEEQMTQAMVLHPDGRIERLDAVPDLEAMQAAVGGFVELVPLSVDLSGWINEEGKYAGANGSALATNEAATKLTRATCGLLDGDWVAGPMLVTGGADDDGETLPIPPEWLPVLDRLDG